MSEHVRPVAGALLTEDIDTVSYALGAALDGPPWSSTIIGLWDVLVSPWLRKHGRSLAARHLYYRGLRSVPSGAAAELLNAADRWLATYPTLLEAGYVLGPLLGRTDLEAGEARGAATAGLGWLAPYPTLQEAQFVLHPLLGRTDLEAGEARKVVTAGLGWLATYPTLLEAQFVLGPLLGRTDLEVGEVRRAVTAGLRWLDSYPTLEEAGYVLAPVLGRTDLEVGEARKAATAGLGWLATYPTLQEAGYVLGPLLGRTDLEAGEARKAVTAAFGWLAEHAATNDAEFIFRHLFRRPEPSRLDRSKAAELAIHRLRAVLDTQEASFLLRTLLGDRYLDPDLNIRVVQLGLEWLDVHPADPASDFVFNRILRIPHVDDGSWGRAAGHAFNWLEARIRRDGADRVLFSLIQRPHLLSDNELARIVDATLVCIGPPKFVNRLLLRLEEVVRGKPIHARVLGEIEARGLHPK